MKRCRLRRVGEGDQGRRKRMIKKKRSGNRERNKGGNLQLGFGRHGGGREWRRLLGREIEGKKPTPLFFFFFLCLF